MSEKNTLEPSIIRKLLEGYPGISDELAEQDAKARDEIAAQECPRCGTSCTPRLPADTSRTFQGTKIRYVRWCPTCRTVIE